MDPYKVLKYPVNTEKSMKLMESENKLVFIVDLKAEKIDVKKAAEKLFSVKVEKINTLITPAGKKKAFIKLKKENKAVDVMTQLGLM